LTFLKNQRYKKGWNGATLGADLDNFWGRFWGKKQHLAGRGYRKILRWRNAFFTMAKRVLHRWRNALYQDGEMHLIKMAKRTFPCSL